MMMMNLRKSSSSSTTAVALLMVVLSASVLHWNSVTAWVPQTTTNTIRQCPTTTTTTKHFVASGLPLDGTSFNNNNNNQGSSDIGGFIPVTESSNSDNNSKVGVLLLNLGGPEKTEDVEGFLYNLFADPDIIRLPGALSPLQAVIAYFISKRRAPKSRAAYDSIGGGSPILKYSNAQANLLQQALEGKYDLPVKTYIGMRYWHPFTEEALEQIRSDGIEALVILPLYPQFSISTSGSSLRVLQEEFSRRGMNYFHDMVHTVVPSWYQRPGYVRAVTNLIEHELDSFTDTEIEEAQKVTPDKAPLHVLFSAHGVPQSYIVAGDPYQKQIEASVEQITQQLRNKYTSDRVEIHLSYQSRVGPIEWLRPYTDDVLPTLGQSGVRNLVVVPISFVSEHIETLEEIDIEYRELAEEHGVTNWRRCPALNTDASFIDDMADMVYDALNEPAQTVTEACVANNVGDVDLATPLDDDTVGVGATGVGGVGADGPLYATAVATAAASSRTTKTMSSSTSRMTNSASTIISTRPRSPSSTAINQTRRRLQQQLEMTPSRLFMNQAKAVAPPMALMAAVLVAMSGPSAAQWMGL